MACVEAPGTSSRTRWTSGAATSTTTAASRSPRRKAAARPGEPASAGPQASGADTSPAAIAPAAAPTLIVTFGLLRAEGPGQALRHSPLDPGSLSRALAWQIGRAHV